MGSGVLSDIADIEMGQSPPGSTCGKVASGTPLLNGPTEFGPNHPTPAQWTTDPRKVAHAGDVLFCVRGSTTGRMNWADQDYAIGRGVAAIRHKQGPEYQHFVRGVIESKLPYLLAAATGSTFPNVSRIQLLELPCEIPPLPEQKAIAHILGTLDDKIELNRRMNETLEGIARTIFKSWFVDFDPVRAKAEGRDTGLPKEIEDLFPDGFEDSELGAIPKGWTVVCVEDIAEKVACGPFGSSIKVSTFVPDGVPIISGQHLHGIRVVDGEHNFISREHADRLKNANVFRGDVVFTHAGNIGQAAYIPDSSQYERYVISQRQFYLRCDREKMSPIFMAHFFRTPLGKHKLTANASSTGVPSIARPVTYLKSIRFVRPDISLIGAFESLAKPLHLLGAQTEEESLALGSHRNLLLRVLLNGRVPVPLPQEGDS